MIVYARIGIDHCDYLNHAIFSRQSCNDSLFIVATKSYQPCCAVSDDSDDRCVLVNLATPDRDAYELRAPLSVLKVPRRSLVLVQHQLLLQQSSE